MKPLLSFLGNLSLLSITPDKISNYKVKRRNDGVKPATVNRELVMLSKSLNYAAEDWLWLKEAPRIKREKLNNERNNWLKSDEEKKLLGACLELGYAWLEDIVVFDVHTGLRMDELISLEWARPICSGKQSLLKRQKTKSPGQSL